MILIFYFLTFFWLHKAQMNGISAAMPCCKMCFIIHSHISSDFCTISGYRREGFLAIQDAVDDAVLQEFVTGTSLVQYKSMKKVLRRHPYPPYRKDNYVLVLQQQFPIIIMLSFVVIVLGIVRDIVLEKERRLKVGDLNMQSELCQKDL